MNTVELIERKVVVKYKIGDVFQEPESGEYYLLGEEYGKYYTFCLNDGYMRSGPDSIEEVIKGLTFVGRDMKISLQQYISEENE